MDGRLDAVNGSRGLGSVFSFQMVTNCHQAGKGLRLQRLAVNVVPSVPPFHLALGLESFKFHLAVALVAQRSDSCVRVAESWGGGGIERACLYAG